MTQDTTVYRPYVDQQGVGLGHRAVFKLSETKGKVRVLDLGLLRTFHVPRADFDRARATPPDNPKRLAASMSRRSKQFARHNIGHAPEATKAVVSALRALAKGVE